MKKGIFYLILLLLFVSCGKSIPSWIKKETTYKKEVNYNDSAKWFFHRNYITYDVQDERIEYSTVYIRQWFYMYDVKILESTDTRFVFQHDLGDKEYMVIITKVNETTINVECDNMRITGYFVCKGFYND
jgi:hypothetical protein